MKRRLWLLMLFLFAGHVPAASADSACEGRFVNPITDICWSCIFPLSLGSIKVSQGKVPDTANPSMPIQICPAPPPLFRRIGLAIGYWEPMALTDVRGYLAPRLQRNPTKSVILQTSLEAPYQAMTDVFDELRQVGVQNLVIPTNSELQIYGLRQLK